MILPIPLACRASHDNAHSISPSCTPSVLVFQEYSASLNLRPAHLRPICPKDPSQYPKLTPIVQAWQKFSAVKDYSRSRDLGRFSHLSPAALSSTGLRSGCKAHRLTAHSCSNPCSCIQASESVCRATRPTVENPAYCYTVCRSACERKVPLGNVPLLSDSFYTLHLLFCLWLPQPVVLPQFLRPTFLWLFADCSAPVATIMAFAACSSAQSESSGKSNVWQISSTHPW